MKVIFLGVIALTQVITQRLSYQDQNCKKYLQKFETTNNSNIGETKLAFTGDMSFVSGTTDVQVNLRYTDTEFFNDNTYFGLVQEDGKTADSTCLDLKLWKFTSNSYSDPIQVTDLPITPSSNSEYQWRYYTFIIPGKELRTRLVQTSNSAQYIYKGFYAISYYIADTNQVEYTFYFEFQVTVDRKSGAVFNSVFKPLSYQSTLGCTPNQSCNAKAETILKWCTDITCKDFGIPDLHLNDQFVLQQVITTTGMNYYLTGTQVWYTGNGLYKETIPIQVINTTEGQAIIQLQAEIAWRNVSIKVISTLQSNLTGDRRLLAQNTYDQVTGETQEIVCIKLQGSDLCPTCEQELAVNGFKNEDCREDDEGNDEGDEGNDIGNDTGNDKGDDKGNVKEDEGEAKGDADKQNAYGHYLVTGFLILLLN